MEGLRRWEEVAVPVAAVVVAPLVAVAAVGDVAADLAAVIAIVFGVAIITVLLFVWWRRAKNQKNLEAKQTAEMLNTPLEKFDDVEIEDLAKKYEDNPPETPDEDKA
nr:hypothetical protein [uncultured Acetobacterium sp.]